MKNYLITYDLRKPGRNYQELYDAIKRLGSDWCWLVESVWIIRYTGTGHALCSALLKHIDENDKLFVVDVGRDASWYGLPKEVSDWLKARL